MSGYSNSPRRTHMPKSQQSKPHLVPVDAIPKSTRRSLYSCLTQFAKVFSSTATRV